MKYLKLVVGIVLSIPLFGIICYLIVDSFIKHPEMLVAGGIGLAGIVGICFILDALGYTKT